MAVSITQQPTSPNVAYTKLLFVVSGSGTTSNDQYKYVADLFISGSTERLGRFKTVANEAGVGVIDFSTPIQGNLEYDSTWKTSPASPTTQSARTYIVKFGEEYGTSPSSSVTVYDGAGSPGDPSISSNDLFVFKGTIDNATLDSFNFDETIFDTGSFTQPNFNNTESGYNELRGPRLSNYPEGYQDINGTIPKVVGRNDYETISFFQELESGAYYSSSLVQIYYSGSNTTNAHLIEAVTGATDDIRTLGVGPQNLMDLSTPISQSFTGSWTHYLVDLNYIKASTIISSSYWYVNEEVCDLELTQSTFQVYAPGVWTTKNPLPVGIQNTEGAGTSVAGAWSVGGLESTGTSNRFYTYDGTNFSTGTGALYATYHGMNAGTQTSAYVMGGLSSSGANTSATQYYNGVSWAAGSNMSTQRTSGTSIGDYSAVHVVGGGAGATNLTSEKWNGSVWSTGPVPSAAVYEAAGAGVFDDFIITRGTGTIAISFNGTVFSNITSPTINDNYGMGAGSSNTSGIIWGGEIGGGSGASATKSTEFWNGTTWTADTNLNIGVWSAANAGSTDSALTWGGQLSPGGTYYFYVQEWSRALLTITDAPPINYHSTSKDGKYETIRFAFINQYGYWDYYNIINPIIKNTKVTRENVILPQANYSSTSVTYDMSRRAKTQYYASLEDSISITTDYLTQDQANWLTELFESPYVYEQINNGNGIEFVPIVITNSNYTWDTNGRQRLFQYTINYKRANQRRSRL